MPKNELISMFSSHTWVSWGNLVKCFGIQIVDHNVFFLRVYMRRDIFPNRIRPGGGGFSVLLHYPNQLMASMHTVMRQWARRDPISNYWMSFNVKNMYAGMYRFKGDKKGCIRNWRNYDHIIMEEHLKSVGCKTPDQIINSTWPLCKSCLLYTSPSPRDA